MDSNGINKAFTEFYEKLYISSQASGLMEGFFSNLNLPKPNDQQKRVLNRLLGFIHFHYAPLCPTDHLVCPPLTLAY